MSLQCGSAAPRHAATLATLWLAMTMGSGLSCAPDPDPRAGTEGELVVHLIDLSDRVEKVFALRTDAGATRTLRLPTPTPLPGGTRVRVQGTDDGQSIHVTALEPLTSGGEARALLT